MDLSRNTNTALSSAGAAAGTGDVNGTSVDMTGFGGCVFTILMGSITAGAATAAKLQQSSDNGSTDDWTDVAGSGVTIPDDADGKLVHIDIRNPQKVFLRPVVTRATQNSAVTSITARRYAPRKQPTTQTADVAGSVYLEFPAEGTP